jgi:hypothetical protein
MEEVINKVIQPPGLQDMVIALEIFEANHPYDSPAIEAVQQAIEIRAEEIYEYCLTKLA